MMKEFANITEFLDNNGVEYSVHEHEPVYTSKQAASVRGFDLKTGVKSLVFKAEKDHTDFILVLVSGNRKVDSKRLAHVLNAKNVKLASPEEVLEKTGCEIGSVHPFGNLNGLQVYMDQKILENKIVAFNVGLHTMTVTMNPKDLEKVVKPTVCDISKE